jgi:predicted transposase YbfD/YdcC
MAPGSTFSASPSTAAHLLDHLEVDVKHNETSHFTALLGPLDLDGAVVTFDALHTVRANLDWLAGQKKGHYIAVVKRNQPLLCGRSAPVPRLHDRRRNQERCGSVVRADPLVYALDDELAEQSGRGHALARGP